MVCSYYSVNTPFRHILGTFLQWCAVITVFIPPSDISLTPDFNGVQLLKCLNPPSDISLTLAFNGVQLLQCSYPPSDISLTPAFNFLCSYYSVYTPFRHIPYTRIQWCAVIKVCITPSDISLTHDFSGVQLLQCLYPLPTFPRHMLSIGYSYLSVYTPFGHFLDTCFQLCSVI